MHESLSWRFVCLFLNCGDSEEVSEKHIMAAERFRNQLDRARTLWRFEINFLRGAKLIESIESNSLEVQRTCAIKI